MCLVYLIFSFRACLHWEDYLFFLSVLSTDDCSLESMFKNHWAESETHFRQTVVWAGDWGGNSVAECEPTIYKALDSTLNANQKSKKENCLLALTLPSPVKGGLSLSQPSWEMQVSFLYSLGPA